MNILPVLDKCLLWLADFAGDSPCFYLVLVFALDAVFTVSALASRCAVLYSLSLLALIGSVGPLVVIFVWVFTAGTGSKRES